MREFDKIIQQKNKYYTAVHVFPVFRSVPIKAKYSLSFFVAAEASIAKINQEPYKVVKN